MKNNYLQNFLSGFQDTFNRFPIAVSLTALAAIWQILLIKADLGSFIVSAPFIGFFPFYAPFASLLSFVLGITLERTNWKPAYKWLTQALTIIGVWCVIYFTIDSITSRNFISATNITQVISIFIAIILVPSFLPFLRKNTDRAYVNFYLRSLGYNIKSTFLFLFIYACIFGLVLGIDSMFFNVYNFEWMLYMNAAMYLGCNVYCMSLFSSTEDIYDNTTERDFKIAKKLSYYVLLPIIGLHLLFVYLYCIKLIATGSYPFDFAMVYCNIVFFTCIFTMYLLYNETEKTKLAKFFSRWIWVILIPLFAVMTMDAIQIYNNNTGILKNTLLWYMVWVFGVAIFLFITKSKKLKWVIISFIAFVLLYAFLPFGMYYDEKRSCEETIEKYVEDNELLAGDSCFYMGELCNLLNTMYDDNKYSETNKFCDAYNKAIDMDLTEYLKEKCVNFNKEYKLTRDFYREESEIIPDSCYIPKKDGTVGYGYRFEMVKKKDVNKAERDSSLIKAIDNAKHFYSLW